MSYIFKLKVILFACLVLLVIFGGRPGQAAERIWGPEVEEEGSPSEDLGSTNFNPDERVKSAYQNLIALPFCHKHIVRKAHTGSIIDISEEEFVAPDRYRKVDTDPRVEIIDIKNRHYVKGYPNPGWQKNETMTASQWEDHKTAYGVLNIEKFRGIMEHKIKDAEQIGTEKINGKRMLVYQIEEHFEGETIRRTIIWVGASDNLPYKEEVHMRINISRDRSFLFNYEIVNYDYDRNVEIEAPM